MIKDVEPLAIVLPEIENESFIFKKQNIIVKPFLLTEDKASLIKEYITNLYSDRNNFINSYLIAEYALKAQVIDLCTNIDLFKEGNDIDVDKLIYFGIWEEIKTRIVNYDELLKDIQVVLANDNNILSILKNINDLNVDKLQDISQELASNINKLEEKASVVSSVIEAKEVEVEQKKSPRNTSRKQKQV